MAPTWSRMVGVAKRYSLLPSMLTYSVLYPSANIVQQKDTLGHLAAKVFLDQTCFAPVGLSCFYVGLSTLEGKSREGIYKEWKDKFPNTWAISVFVWPFLQTINFRFVPAKFRPIYVGVFSFFWTTGLAGLKYNDQMPKVFKATGILVWPIFQAINFKFVPGRLRTIYVGFCGFFWFTFLAYVKSTEKPWRSPVLDIVNKHANTNF